MKRLGILIAVVVLLLVGGGLTAQLMSNTDPMPVLRQTANPDGAVQDVLGWKAEQLFLVIGFILFNLVGIAVTIAVIIWLADRGLRKSRAEAAKPPKAPDQTNAPQNS